MADSSAIEWTGALDYHGGASSQAALSVRSEATRRCFRAAENNARRYGLLDLEAAPAGGGAEAVQQWVAWNHARGIAPTTTRQYLRSLRPLLKDAGYSVDGISVPRMLREVRPSLSRADIRAVIKAADSLPLRALACSGLRVGELAQLTPDDLTPVGPRMRVHVRARYTKTGRGRVTFFSRRLTSQLDLSRETVFSEWRTPRQFANFLNKQVRRAREKIGSTAGVKDYAQRRYAFHPHALRAYFITTLNEVSFAYGHVLAGHAAYYVAYNRPTEASLLAAYRNAEKRLDF